MIDETALVRNVYAKSPKTEKDVEYLKQWLLTQKHLPEVTEYELIIFLNRCKNSLEATKTRLDLFFTLKSCSPEYFSNRDPLDKHIQQECKVSQITPLTSSSPENYLYLFTRLINPDASRMNVETELKRMGMIFDAMVRRPTMPAGLIVLCDMTDFTLGHVMRASPIALKKIALYLQKAGPIKFKAIHVFNATPALNNILLFLKPFMSQTITNLIHVYPVTEGMAKLYQHVPQSVMPKDYGGGDDTLDNLCRANMKELVALREWFAEEEQRCKVDETKRTCPLENYNELFGQHGSFRELSID